MNSMDQSFEGLISLGCGGLISGAPKGRQEQTFVDDLPSGKRSHNYGKSPFLMGKSTINGHFQ